MNDADLDWPNIAEEIETVGRNELRACQSYLVQALAHNAEGGGVAAVSGGHGMAAPLAVPATCPVGLDELLDTEAP